MVDNRIAGGLQKMQQRPVPRAAPGGGALQPIQRGPAGGGAMQRPPIGQMQPRPNMGIPGGIGGLIGGYDGSGINPGAGSPGMQRPGGIYPGMQQQPMGQMQRNPQQMQQALGQMQRNPQQMQQALGQMARANPQMQMMMQQLLQRMMMGR